VCPRIIPATVGFPGHWRMEGNRKSWEYGFRSCTREGYLVAHPTARKWVITPVINGISRVNPLITGVITHLLSGMSHQVVLKSRDPPRSSMERAWVKDGSMCFSWFRVPKKSVVDLFRSYCSYIGFWPRFWDKPSGSPRLQLWPWRLSFVQKLVIGYV
jgi:hypothetical protein